MFKKSFLGLNQPRFEYAAVSEVPIEPERVSVPERVTLFFKTPLNGKKNPALKNGDRVKTGQKLLLYKDVGDYVISTVTGTVESLTAYTGDFGAVYTALTLRAEAKDEFDDTFKQAIAENGEEALKDFLAGLPGGLPLNVLTGKEIDTLVVCGVDKDLLMATNQFVLRYNVEAVSKGISVLKKATGIHKVVVALPQTLIPDAGAVGGASGVEMRAIDRAYPSALPQMIMKEVMGKVIPAGKTSEEMGVCFISAEAVAAVGHAFMKERLPVTKTLTLIKKDMSRIMVEARIGTPIGDIFKSLNITPMDKDRLIVGGPLTGSTIYSENHPICPDTDALMVQDNADISMVSDYPCINCGECVRICPANVPVNMLIRFLEAKKYEEGAELYDLYSCIECGLCSFVCVSKIPVFQYIKLAKYELDRMPAEEEVADA